MCTQSLQDTCIQCVCLSVCGWLLVQHPLSLTTPVLPAIKIIGSAGYTGLEGGDLTEDDSRVYIPPPTYKPHQSITNWSLMLRMSISILGPPSISPSKHKSSSAETINLTHLTIPDDQPHFLMHTSVWPQSPPPFWT